MWCDFMSEICKCHKCEYDCTKCVECKKEKEANDENNR